MTPKDIHKALTEIRDTFPKSSKMFVAFIEQHSKTGVFEGTSQEAVAISMKNAWQLEDKPPTTTFAPTDEAVISYAKSVAEGAAQSHCKMLVVIDMNKPLTSVWVVPKGMCFIATAAYGSPLAPEVMTLRQFRDDVLLCSRLGRAFVSFYYFASPPLALLISKHKCLRAMTRECLLQPILHLIKKG